MLNTNDSQSIEWFIDEKIKPLKKEIKKLQLENKELNEKFSLYGVSHRRELLIDFAEKVYRRVFFTWDKKTSEKVVDEYIKGNL